MYLVINLAIIDMVLGGVRAYVIIYVLGLLCNLWKLNSIEVRLYVDSVVAILSVLFLAASFTNIAIIALERMHATFFPFRHRLLKKWVYRLVIAVVWVTSGLITICIICILLVQFDPVSRVYYVLYLGATFCLICLLIICASYSSIVIKIRRGAQPQHHGAASRERKLTMTLLIVTVVSLLLCLPRVILMYFAIPISQSWSLSLRFHLGGAFDVLSLANSLANPILYAMRMPEYRSALLALFRKRIQPQRQVVDLPLRDM